MLLNEDTGCSWFESIPLLPLLLNSPFAVPLMTPDGFANPFDSAGDAPAVWKQLVPGLVENIELEVAPAADCQAEAAAVERRKKCFYKIYI